jgi:phosphate acetyltransferase
VSLSAAAAGFLEHLEERLRTVGGPCRIAFPEGGDPRVIAAAARLVHGRLAQPVLIGHPPAVAPPGLEFIDPATSEHTARYAQLLYERRRSSGMSERAARSLAARPLYFAALMVAAGDAAGSVGGAANSTAETVRAALHSIGTAPGIRTVSSFFVLAVQDQRLGRNGLFIAADCAVVVEPNAAQLADIALAAAASARTFLETEPRVALLAAGSSPALDETTRLLERKAPGLRVSGDMNGANTLVFPNLDSANIGYKLVEWLGGASAFGPMLQGLARPANDLSRACTVDDVYSVAMVTCLQAKTGGTP